jgi:ankyrin repeat protein
MDSHSLPPIFAAAESGDLEAISRLLSQGTPVNQPLDAALLSEQRKYQVVTGVNSGEDYAYYETCRPLAVAIARGQTAAALLLLEAGANPRPVVGDEMPPLAVAVREGNVEVASRLLTLGASPSGGYETSLLYEAASRGQVEIVQLLLSAGANANDSGSEYGETALHAAARVGNSEIVRMLLSQGASKATSSEEGSPADIAKHHGHLHLLPDLS